MTKWLDVCDLEEIPKLGARVVNHGDLAIAVFRNADNEVFALEDRCPHKGGPLSQGIVFGTSVACPLHNWTIGLCDGQASAPDKGCTPQFAVKVDGDAVYLNTAELASHATDLERPIAGPIRRTACA